MKTFLNSFWNLVFCWRLISSNFPPNENFKNSPFSLFFPLDFEKFQFPPDFVEFKNPVPPPSQRGGSRYEYAWRIPRICLNGFYFTFIHCNSLSKEPYTVSLENKNLIFFYSSWKYLILFVLDWIFFQVKFKVCCYFWGPMELGLWILPNQWYIQ